MLDFSDKGVRGGLLLEAGRMMEVLGGVALGYKQGPLVELTAKNKLKSCAAVVWRGWHSTL